MAEPGCPRWALRSRGHARSLFLALFALLASAPARLRPDGAAPSRNLTRRAARASRAGLARREAQFESSVLATCCLVATTLPGGLTPFRTEPRRPAKRRSLRPCPR